VKAEQSPQDSGQPGGSESRRPSRWNAGHAISAALESLRSRRGQSLARTAESALSEHWTTVGGAKVFYRESRGVAGPVMMHVHGFGLSGRYLLPTAELLAQEFHTFVPDLPGFGRSGGANYRLDVPDLAHAAAAFLDDRNIQSATLVGNSMGCPVICEFAHLYPERLDRAILVSPAGGLQNRPLPRAVGQLARDGIREPTRLLTVAVPDYIRFGVGSTWQLFRALTQYPALERLLALRIPTLAVLGVRDPLMPPAQRVREVASQTDNHVSVVIIEGAAHAINFSHPGELANVIRLFMADQPIVDDPDSPGHAYVAEIHRGSQLPEYG
jgi:pimeloyl-ACP methyl ester carboxylesterase